MCAAAFATAKQLQQHELTHAPGHQPADDPENAAVVFNCQLCSYTGQSRRSVITHTAWAHKKTKEEVSSPAQQNVLGEGEGHSWDQCSYTSDKLRSLSIHKGRVHGSKSAKGKTAPSSDQVCIF